jgi:hypothetical protein
MQHIQSLTLNASTITEIIQETTQTTQSCQIHEHIHNSKHL